MLDNTVIEKAVKSYAETTTAERIKAAGEQCDKIVIAGPGDHVSIEMAQKYLRKLVKTRTAIEAKRKWLKEPGLKYCRDVDAEAKRLQALLAPIELSMEQKLQTVQRQIADEAAVKAEAEQKLYAARSGQLFAAGVMFNGIAFVCGTLQLTQEEVKAFTDGGFDAALAAMVAEKARVDVVMAQQQNAAGDGLDALRNKTQQTVVETPVETVTPVVQETVVPVVENNVAPVVKQEEKPVVSAPQNTAAVIPVEYSNGFNDCKAKVLKILDSPEKFTRVLLYALINELKP